MPRPLRIQYANAWYHVMNRGAGRKRIFKKNLHREMFLNTLKECHQMFNLKIHAYCLMSNHYHLLVSTPDANLSRAMRHLDGVYTQRFNSEVNIDGALFRGRYTAKLIEDESYQMVVSQYIHLNPVEAGIVKEAHEYKWSSYRAKVGLVDRPLWLCTDIIVEKFPPDISVVAIPDTPIVGSQSFKDKVLLGLNDKVAEACAPDIKRCKSIPEIRTIIDATCEYYGIDYETLQYTQRNKLNLPRLICMYMSRKIFGHTLSSIAKTFHYRRPSTVSSYISKLEQQGLTKMFNHDMIKILARLNLLTQNREKIDR